MKTNTTLSVVLQIFANDKFCRRGKSKCFYLLPDSDECNLFRSKYGLPVTLKYDEEVQYQKRCEKCLCAGRAK